MTDQNTKVNLTGLLNASAAKRASRGEMSANDTPIDVEPDRMGHRGMMADLNRLPRVCSMSKAPLQLLQGLLPENLWARPVQVPATSTFGSTQLSQDAHIAAYFKYFHPSLPLLHRPTIVKNCPDLLAKIIVAIGSLYSSHSLPEPDASSCRTWSQSLWEAGHDELGRLSSLACQGLQRTWVMQAWLLHIIYGAFMGDAAQHHKAKSLLRGLVDTVHDLGLLKQAAVSTESPSWIDALGTDEAGLHDRWMRYANEEAMKLCMHTVLFLDFHVLHPCNIRSLTSAVDLSWELPFSSALWESETAADWVETLFKEPRALAILQPNEELCFQDPPAQSLFFGHAISHVGYTQS
ncbi:hypothetical protein NM208_g227 [Fusarium decemcellulare]|uniref:Uncharacterized protein n=1 Tax=Fusarium decemcellulare TaxID=57161 RepID=A0ACC1T0J3_9HYPO|nr:hypothetical protein NM208_g227 [Fusarium decemcellulare]